ncbi:MAG: ChbG/HpnK family deacetylase [Acidobacteria bacterium]|nr:ChbG/HpnK family deacetylase [Acidobacteriota bacterium]
MKKLIVTADDFGLTDVVSHAIIEGYKKGIITSASLMANGAGFESVAAFARQAPKLGVGVHLNLTEGRPVSQAASIPSLVNSQGLFFEAR